MALETYIHPNFKGLSRRLGEVVMCSRCGNVDPDTMIVETRETRAIDEVRKVKGEVQWIGYRCACCQHVTTWT